MLTRITAAICVTLAMLAASTRLPANSCILAQGPSEKACQMNCCANKTCCATSRQRTAPTAHPLAKADSTADLVAPAVVTTFSHPAPATQPVAFANAAPYVHSPPTLALLCTFLI